MFWSFIGAHWINILVAVLAIGLAVALIVAKKNRLVLQFMILAEKKADEYALAHGEDKAAFVADYALPRIKKIPVIGPVIGLFITRDAIITAVNDLLYEAYDLVDDGKFDHSWTPEEKAQLEQQMLDSYNDAKQELPESVTAIPVGPPAAPAANDPPTEEKSPTDDAPQP